MRYNDILQELGGWGRYQKLITVLVVVSAVANGFYTMSPVFILDIPRHHCTIGGNQTMANLSTEEMMNITIPLEKDDAGEWKRSECSIYSEIGNTSSAIECGNGWTYYPQYEEYTAFMEWNVVCGGSWIKPLVLALFMSGIMVGSIMSGAVCDRFGRRPSFLWGSFFHFLPMFIMGFSTSPHMFGGLLFVVGASGMVKYAAAFVIISELVEASKRALVGNLTGIGFSLGYMILPLFSYYMINWRWLIWFTGAGGLLFLPYFWLLPESPRWLIMNGKPEAKNLIRKIAKFNGVTIPEDTSIRIEKELCDDAKEKDLRKQFTYFDLFKISGIRLRSFIMCFIWFSASMTYYCISLGTSDLVGNKFVNCFLAAAVELPALFSSIYLMDRFGRKFVLFAFLVLGGTSLALASAFLKHQTLLVIFAMTSKLCVTAVFSLVYIYSCELFPTKMRNMSVGAFSTMARVGGIVAPYLGYAGEKLSPVVPYVTMGGFAVLSGILTLLLPETLNVPLPETVEDAVNIKRKQLRISKSKQNSCDGALEKLRNDSDKNDQVL